MSVLDGFVGFWDFLLTSTCSITRVDRTTPGLDVGSVYAVGINLDGTNDDVTANVPCSFQPSNSSESFGDMREKGEAIYDFFLPTDYTLTTEDRITHNSIVYDVLGPGIEQGAGSQIQAVAAKVRAR